MKLTHKKNIRISFLIIVFAIIECNSQVLSNNPTVPIINSENAFFDASTSFDSSVSNSNEGKGFVFPRTDLTQWVFKTELLDGITFPTAFDGMIVYNSGTGITILGQGKQVYVSPGFYYFNNPNATTDISNGSWYLIEFK